METPASFFVACANLKQLYIHIPERLFYFSQSSIIVLVMKLSLTLICLFCVCSLADEEIDPDFSVDTENTSKSAQKDDEPFDHSAFLQVDDSALIKIQNSKESKIKMRKLIKKIDNDKDGKLSEKEIEDWIKDVTGKYIVTEGETQMVKIDTDGDKHASWEEYKAAAGYSKGDEPEPRKSSEESKTNDKEKFDLADSDHDGKLSYYELGIMVHPVEAMQMSAVVVREFLEGIDKDNDGKISAKEFSGEGAELEELGGTFTELDTDKDGALNTAELTNWLAPEGMDPFKLEAETLRKGIDDDKDGFLTEEEIFKHYENFATSRATQYGRLIKPDDKSKRKPIENETRKMKADDEL